MTPIIVDGHKLVASDWQAGRNNILEQASPAMTCDRGMLSVTVLAAKDAWADLVRVDGCQQRLTYERTSLSTRQYVLSKSEEFVPPPERERIDDVK